MSSSKNNLKGKSESKYDKIPESMADFLTTVAGTGNFTIRFFRQLFSPHFESREFIRQAFRLGYKSLLLVGISGFIIGLVMTLQVKPTMEEFGAEAWIPSMISISIIREIGPVLTALICAGKVGSGIGAELGSMKVTEQIDAMSVSGANPFKYIVVTRVLATTLMVPILVVYTDSIAILGSFVGLNLDSDVSPTLFFTRAMEQVKYVDVFPSLIKSALFGFAIGIVGCYRGYNSKGGTVGVGDSANSAVVLSSVLIFVIDLMAVQIKQLFL